MDTTITEQERRAQDAVDSVAALAHEVKRLSDLCAERFAALKNAERDKGEAVTAAIAAERKACAEVAEYEGEAYDAFTAMRIADRIRARK